MIDLVQYRTSIGLFASVISKSAKKRNTKVSFKTLKNSSKPTAKIKTTTKDEDVTRERSYICLQLLTVVLCLHVVCCNQFLDTNTELLKHSDIFCSFKCTVTEILHCNVYGSVECWEILDYGDVASHNANMLLVNYSDTLSYSDVRSHNDNMLLVNYSDTLSYSDVRSHNDNMLSVNYSDTLSHSDVRSHNDNMLSVNYSDTLSYSDVRSHNDNMLALNYSDTWSYSDVSFKNRHHVKYNNQTIDFHGNRSEHGVLLPSDICVEHSYFICQSMCNGLVMIRSLELCPYPGTCCYLLGNKGMHCYNGNPPTGLNLTEEAIKKQRLCVLLVDGGSQALRYTISRIVLDMKLQNVDGQTRGQLCVNDRSLLYPAGLVLPSLDGLTQAGLDMVWTKALQQSPVTSATAQNMKDMIYDYLVSDGLDIQLKNNKQRVQELNNEKRLLSKEQWDILYPRLNATVDLESFDMTLLCFVILHVFQFKPTSGIWSQDPPTGDVGIGDDILRLRKQRNELAHNSSRMDDTTFRAAWREIRGVLHRLKPGQEFYDRIQHLHDCRLVDPEKAAESEQLIVDWINHDKRLEHLDSDLSVIQESPAQTRRGEKHDSDEDRIDIGDPDASVSQGRRKINKTSLSSTTISSTHDGPINIIIKDSSHIHFNSIGTTIATESVKKRAIEVKDNTSKDNGASQTHEDRPHFMLNTVAAWRRENIYITKGVEAVTEKISSKGCVCVIGVPGAGKSTALHHAALSLQSDGFIIYCVNGPEEFLKYYDINKKQVFVLDDALGVYSVDQGKVKTWQEQNENVRLALGTNTKLLVSIRTQIFMYETIRDKDIVFLDKSETTDHVNYSDADYKLGIDDMRGMLTHYMKNKGTDPDIIDKVIKQVWPYTEKQLTEMPEGNRQWVMSQYTAGVEFADCFPLCCRVFVNSDTAKQNPEEFFTNPFPALTKVFQNIKTDNKHQFCALVLSTMFDGKLTDDLVSPLSESPLCDDKNKRDKDKEIRNYIMSTYKLKCPDDLEDLQSALNSLTGVYILHVGDRYKISHAVFYDIVTYLYNDPLFVFKYGTREFIRDRVRLNKDEQQLDPYVLVYSDDTNIERLADRLFRDYKSDIETGAEIISWYRDPWTGARFITENPNIHDDRLISCLRSKLSDREQTDKKMIDDLFRQCMWTVLDNSHTYKHGDVPSYKLIELCLQREADCNMYIDGDYPLHISVMTGSLQLIQLLLQHGADKRRVDGGGSSVLHYVCIHTKYNRVELVKLLVQGDLSVVDWEGRTVIHDNILTHVDYLGRNILHYSVDDYDLTKHLLTYPSLQKLIHKCDKRNRTPCWYIINNKKPRWYSDSTEDIVIKKKQDMIQLYRKHCIRNMAPRCRYYI